MSATDRRGEIHARLLAEPGPEGFDKSSPRFVVAAWEVLFDLLCGYVHPRGIDVVIAEMEGTHLEGGPLGPVMKRIMTDWSLSNAYGRTSSIATRLADDEMFETIRGYNRFVGLLDREADLDLGDDLTALSGEGSHIAGVLNELLMSARIERAHRASAKAPGDGVQKLEMGSDGTYTYAASNRGDYTPDGRTVEIHDLVLGFLQDVLDGLRTSPNHYPTEWEPQLREAVALKRAGSFLASARIYVDLSRWARTVYPGVMLALYKTVASAGDLAAAHALILASNSFYVQAGVPGDGNKPLHEDHLSRLRAAVGSSETLTAYLRDINGNGAYAPPRPHAVMVSEWELATAGGGIASQRTAEQDRPQEPVEWEQPASGARAGSVPRRDQRQEPAQTLRLAPQPRSDDSVVRTPRRALTVRIDGGSVTFEPTSLTSYRVVARGYGPAGPSRSTVERAKAVARRHLAASNDRPWF